MSSRLLRLCEARAGSGGARNLLGGDDIGGVKRGKTVEQIKRFREKLHRL